MAQMIGNFLSLWLASAGVVHLVSLSFLFCFAYMLLGHESLYHDIYPIFNLLTVVVFLAREYW